MTLSQVLGALLAAAAGCAIVFFALWRQTRRQLDAAQSTAADLRSALQNGSSHEGQVSERLAALGAAAEEALLICKLDRTVIYLNAAAEALFGNPGAVDHPSLIVLTRRHELDRLAAEALAGHELDDRLFALHGRTFRARAVAFPGGVAIAITDVSELQRLGRARRDFVANISHELRTPLTSIRLLTDTLRSPAGQELAVAKELVSKIIVETDALSQLAQELLDLSAIESGQAVLRMVAEPVRPVLAAAVARLAEFAARKQHAVALHADDSLQALMDRPQVERVVINLLHNAIKFTGEGGSITLGASTADDSGGEWTIIEVADSGQGIAADDLPRIFERFYRADGSRSSGGTGLGLAIAKHIVEAHGGRIWAESGGIGRGSRFKLLLPRR